MTARPSALGAVLYENETNFKEDVDTTSTRLEIASEVDVSGLMQEAIEASSTEQLLGEGYRVVAGPKGGSFSFDVYLTGHGSDPGAGAVTASDLYTLLKDAAGNGYASGDGGLAAGTGDEDTVNTDAVTGSTYTGWFIGTAGDGRGNGQGYLASNLTSNTLTLHNGMEAAASENDEVRAALTVYPLSLPASMDDVTSMRFLLQTANRQYLCHGCWLSGVSPVGFGPREVPRLTLTFSTAWWETKSSTFPNATAASAKTPAPNMGGSFWFNSSSTYRTYCLRSFNVTINHTPIVTESVCGDATESVICCVKHGGSLAEIEVVLEAEAAGTDTFYDHFAAGDLMRAMYTLNSEPGKAVALYFPNLAWMSYPEQINFNGQNAIRCRLRTKANISTSIDRHAAPWHLLMG